MSEAVVISKGAISGNSGMAGAVLIIDDEAEIRESLQTLLELEGFLPLCCVRPRHVGQARRAHQHPPQLIALT